MSQGHATSRRHICQVAITALNGPALRDWYANVFGLVKSGKTIFFPPSSSRVQGVPCAWEKCSWLIDRQDYFQLEFFQFWSPRSCLKPNSWRPCDIGYNMMGIAVDDFDQVIRNVGAFSRLSDLPVTGDPGERCAVVADPEGNLVAIYESDPLRRLDGGQGETLRPELPSVVRSMRVSVPDLELARQTYVEAMGLQVVEDFTLHSEQHEALWGLGGAQRSTLLLRSANFLLELVEYHSPRGQGWAENYQLSDQGYMNIALGYRDRTEFDRAFGHAVNSGVTPNGEVVDIGVFRVMYVTDPQGFSVEMLNARRRLWSLSGFNAQQPHVELELDINAPAERVWQHLVDHAGIGAWTIFQSRILREGRIEPNGVGCIRELRAPGLRITEEITGWEAGRHYSYQLRSGAPFNKHQGDVFVVEMDGRVRVRWAIRFESWIPFTGKLTAWLLGMVFGRALARLKALLET